MLKLNSVLYTTGCRGGWDVCDVIFEGGPGKCDEVWRKGEEIKFFLKIAWRHLWTTPKTNYIMQLRPTKFIQADYLLQSYLIACY